MSEAEINQLIASFGNDANQTRAKRAQRSLEILRSEIGPMEWIEKAISACDALDAGLKLKQNGCPIGYTWKDMGL